SSGLADAERNRTARLKSRTAPPAAAPPYRALLRPLLRPPLPVGDGARRPPPTRRAYGWSGPPSSAPAPAAGGGSGATTATPAPRPSAYISSRSAAGSAGRKRGTGSTSGRGCGEMAAAPAVRALRPSAGWADRPLQSPRHRAAARGQFRLPREERP